MQFGRQSLWLFFKRLTTPPPSVSVSVSHPCFPSLLASWYLASVFSNSKELCLGSCDLIPKSGTSLRLLGHKLFSDLDWLLGFFHFYWKKSICSRHAGFSPLCLLQWIFPHFTKANRTLLQLKSIVSVSLNLLGWCWEVNDSNYQVTSTFLSCFLIFTHKKIEGPVTWQIFRIIADAVSRRDTEFLEELWGVMWPLSFGVSA